jgi:ornithine cyclodeaminase/alanine dehydrogenase-like protein (mu-crystallin family)
MQDAPILWLREQDVVDAVSLNDAIENLAVMLRREGEGHAKNLPKVLGTLPGSASLHALCSALTNDRYCGTKTWINSSRGAIALYALFDSDSGRALAVLEANALGSLRTAGMSGLATDLLAADDADELAIVGAGRQALLQVAAVTVVRPIRRIRAYSRDAERQQGFATLLRKTFGIEVETPRAIMETIAQAPIVTLVTRATEPFLTGDMLAHGAHVNAVGAVLPHQIEFDKSVFHRASAIVVDNLVNVQNTSREFTDYFGSPGASWAKVETLGQRIMSGGRRPEATDLTLFKSVGMGLADLAVAVPAYETAQQRGLGTKIAYPTRSAARWETFASRAQRAPMACAKHDNH